MINSFKLSFVLSKKLRNIGEIFAEYWQKTARPGPLKFGSHRPGPARFVKPGIYNPGAESNSSWCDPSPTTKRSFLCPKIIYFIDIIQKFTIEIKN